MPGPDHPVVKLCGLADSTTVQVAIDLGATAVGFMLAQSRRQVSVAAITEIGSMVPRERIQFVAVTVNAPPEQIHPLFEQDTVDIVQLSGDESPELLDAVGGRYWKALRFPTGTSPDVACRELDRWLDHDRPVEQVLVDASVPGAYGGTGHRADWDLVARLAERFPIVLAGGLNPDNVHSAIEATGVAGVDVSSGIESDGRKDHDKMRQFVAEARRGFGHT